MLCYDDALFIIFIIEIDVVFILCFLGICFYFLTYSDNNNNNNDVI